jgi:hypothetical protein
MRKIVIGTPWVSAFMHTRWVDAALKLRPPSGCSIEWIRGLGWCDARRIHYIIEHALEADADLVAFLDGDVIVPPEWLETMTKHMETGIRAVASVVPMRGRAHEQNAPFEGMAWNVVGEKLVQIDPRDGLQTAQYVSLGAAMFDASIFREEDRLWTWHEYDVHLGYKAVGSTADSILMKNIQKRGIQIYADPSMAVGHLHTFEIDQTFGERFPEWEVGQQ